jgi:glyoxylase-like metal-dependent hydrolase (beta-lactamase superfamily II)
MEVIDGIYRIDTRLGARVSSMYIVRGSRSCLLFDVGVDGDPSTTVGPYLDAQGIDRRLVEWVVVSHCDVDHFGGLADARTTFPFARVLAHVADRGAITNFQTYLELRGRGFKEPYGLDEAPDVLVWARSVTREGPIDSGIVGSEVIDLGDRDVEILHVPGHSRGHLALRDRIDRRSGHRGRSLRVGGTECRRNGRIPAHVPPRCTVPCQRRQARRHASRLFS